MKVRMISERGTRFFISVAKGELFAYKLTKDEAFNFSSQLFDWENGNKLKVGEFYDGFVAIIGASGKFLLGQMHGCLQHLDPKTNEIRHWPEGQHALENGCLFELAAQESSKLAFFNDMRVIVRDLPIAEALEHSTAWIKPEGDPVDVDRQIKDKIITAALNNEEIELSDEEKRFLNDNFWSEYISLFGSD